MEREKFLEEEIWSHWTIPVKVAVAREPISANELSQDESLRILQWKSPKRRDSWLRGRKALQKLLGNLGENPKTRDIAFPHPRFSLTHSGNFAIAVGMPSPSANSLGIGVDFEQFRAISFDAGRFFLTKEERDWVKQQKESHRENHLLRLWTLKEALFKSRGGSGGKLLTQLALCHPEKWHGNAASCRGTLERFSYLSFRFLEGFVSIAVSWDINCPHVIPAQAGFPFYGTT